MVRRFLELFEVVDAAHAGCYGTYSKYGDELAMSIFETRVCARTRVSSRSIAIRHIGQQQEAQILARLRSLAMEQVSAFLVADMHIR